MIRDYSAQYIMHPYINYIDILLCLYLVVCHHIVLLSFCEFAVCNLRELFTSALLISFYENHPYTFGGPPIGIYLSIYFHYPTRDLQGSLRVMEQGVTILEYLLYLEVAFT